MLLVNIMTLASFLMIFIAAFIFLQVVLGRSRDPIRERLERAVAEGDEGAFGEGRPEDRERFGALAESLAAQIPQMSFEEQGLEQDLRRAGYYRPNVRRDYLALRNGMLFGIIIITGVMAVISGPDNVDRTLEILLVGLIVAGLAFGVPRIMLYLQAQRRVRRIENGLPDALDMISMCVTGGLALQPALERVSRELYNSHPDLAMELTIVRYQAEVGSLGRAFQQMAKRIDVPDVISITTMITQAERLGANVVAALREYADGMRHARRQTAEERANQTGIKLLFPLVFFLAPSVFLLLWGPALLEIRTFFREQTAPGGAFDQPTPDQFDTLTLPPDLGARVGEDEAEDVFVD